MFSIGRAHAAIDAINRLRDEELFLKSIVNTEMFKKLLAVFVQRFKLKEDGISTQQILDQIQHYDIDGVTKKDGKIIIPSFEN